MPWYWLGGGGWTSVSEDLLVLFPTQAKMSRGPVSRGLLTVCSQACRFPRCLWATWGHRLPGEKLFQVGSLVSMVWDPITCPQWLQSHYSNIPKGHNELLRISTAHHSVDSNESLVLLHVCSLRIESQLVVVWPATVDFYHTIPMLHQWILTKLHKVGMNQTNPTEP